jgi:drug/metabolite transporter (DMT)-like permease
MPLMAKFIYADGVNAMTLVFLRSCLALPALAVLALGQSKTLRVPVNAFPSISLMALMGCCITPTLLFLSYNFIASGTATVFHFVYPAVVVLGGVLFLKEKLHLGNLISVVLCVAGIGLFYEPGQPLDWRGSLSALASGFTFAAYVLMLSRFRRKGVTGFLFTFWITAVSSVVMLLVCLATGQLALPATTLGWGLCLLFALAVTCGAVVLFQQGTFLVGGQQASILSTLEPITSIVVGIVIFHEAASLRVIAGSVLVICASILIAVSGMKESRKSVEG